MGFFIWKVGVIISLPERLIGHTVGGWIPYTIKYPYIPYNIYYIYIISSTSFSLLIRLFGFFSFFVLFGFSPLTALNLTLIAHMEFIIWKGTYGHLS